MNKVIQTVETFVELLDGDAMPGLYPGVRQCPACGSRPTLWQHMEPGGTASKVVMCENGDDIVEEETNLFRAACPFFMPPQSFYRATQREAVTYWNRYAEHLTTQRDIRTK